MRGVIHGLIPRIHNRLSITLVAGENVWHMAVRLADPRDKPEDDGAMPEVYYPRHPAIVQQ